MEFKKAKPAGESPPGFAKPENKSKRQGAETPS
jgi:hypothetical protein